MRQEIKSIISDILNNLDDIAEDLTYIYLDLGPYDPITNEQVNFNVEYSLKGVFDDSEDENAIKRLLRAPITSSTLSVTIASNDLPVTPRNSDKVYRKSTDQTFVIHKVNTDPFTAAWQLWLDE